MSLKEYIKALLPLSVLGILKRVLNKLRLRKFWSIKKLKSNTKNLATSKQINLDYILNNNDILNSWEDWQTKLNTFNISNVKAGINSGDQRAIFFLIRHLKPKVILEIGTHVGASTVNIASAISYNQKELNIKSIFRTVDIRDVNSISEKPWLKYGMTKSPIEMIKELEVSSVDFITQDSIEYLNKTVDTFDFIFLDGGHLPETVYQEIPKALNVLNKDGVILLHDYFPNGKPIWPNNYVLEGPYLATERLRKETDITILPLGNLPWKTKLGSNKTSLALCLKREN